ncbi:MAG: hypothetical protein JWL83_1760 [Actinomycetia bacterium]|nr:hypothetical protein [Actinomycetes bacterium]
MIRATVRTWILALVVSVSIVGAATSAGASGATPPARGFGTVTQDVYVSDGSGGLVNPDIRSTPDTAPLFSASGAALGVTWGTFHSAGVTSLAKTIAKRTGSFTDVAMSMTGLIPRGVYSIFYSTFGPDSANPVCPANDSLVALTVVHPKPAQPDASSFVANAGGAAKIHPRVPGRLLDAQNLNILVIYHADGLTWGPVPTRGETGSTCRPSFGSDAMRQLFIGQK